jgi:GT2 family glycosyltransferase
VNVVVLVPRRIDGGRRDQLWGFVKSRWAENHPDWRVVEGHHDDGPFNRSAAINTAARNAEEWDVAVIGDSDSFVSRHQANAAVRKAFAAGQITFAYDRFAYLNRRMSDRVMAGFNGDWWPGVEWTMTGTCSSMVVVPRQLWDEVGGFDEGFVGWGMEDVGFSLACQAIGGGMKRVQGEVWHLHHPSSPENHQSSPLYRANTERVKRYGDCDYDAGKMRALLAELGVTP